MSNIGGGSPRAGGQQPDQKKSCLGVALAAGGLCDARREQPMDSQSLTVERKPSDMSLGSTIDPDSEGIRRL